MSSLPVFTFLIKILARIIFNPISPGGPYGPPEIKYPETQNWLGPKARASGTFSLIQFCMFTEKIGSFACLEKKLEHFCRRQSENEQARPYYSRNHKNSQNLLETCSNGFKFGHHLDINKTNISCKFGENLTR